MIQTQHEDTICAIATPPGTGAVSIIRIAGPNAVRIASEIFKPINKKVSIAISKGFKVYYGSIFDNEQLIDDVLLTIFRNPHSYTGQDSVEISTHGSQFIQQEILKILITHGARIAQPGEFTLRAFMNGKIDLSQAEAIADLIQAHSSLSHQLAIKQMRGGFSSEIHNLRQQLLDFSSLIELELDFSEEDVEFANREQLYSLLNNLRSYLEKLVSSFSLGNVIKTGIPVAIVGKPNVGKSTLLNLLLNEEKAIVSNIPGTTRDTIEDIINIDGVTYRFIDTAGLRESTDEIEIKGIERTYEKISQAEIILYVVDISETDINEIIQTIDDLKAHTAGKDKHITIIANKTDMLIEAPRHFKELTDMDIVFVSAKRKENINLIAESLKKSIELGDISDNTIVSNARHYEALTKALESVINIEAALNANIPGDLIAIDIKSALHHLGLITGEISNDEVLNNIFSRFCIGK